MHVHDLNATILHLMGLNSTMLTYFRGGRHMWLTGVRGHILKQLQA
ncbi:MAG: DUF1501 domain-containing protein [Acidobacteria bacterium]|nr:DUF1501 domain-containing protein [Acidobacteriota bacterium]